MKIYIPTQILAHAFIENGGALGWVDSYVVFEAIVANIGQQLLQIWDLDHTLPAKCLERVIGQAALAQINLHVALKFVG